MCRSSAAGRIGSEGRKERHQTFRAMPRKVFASKERQGGWLDSSKKQNLDELVEHWALIRLLPTEEFPAPIFTIEKRKKKKSLGNKRRLGEQPQQ